MYRLILLFILFVFSDQLSAQERVVYANSENEINTGISVDFMGVKEVGFELDGGIILVEAELNNSTKTFVLDSGAEGLILNNFVKKGKKAAVTGVNGTVEAFSVIVENFVWADISYPKMEAISMDLSHLESLTNRKISGLIGYELIKNFEIFIDYEAQSIQIIGLEMIDGNSKQPMVSFPLTFDNHLPVIEAIIGKEKLRLGLDTGAEVNLLDKEVSNRISTVTSKPKKSTSKIYGVGKQHESTQLVKVALTKIERAAYRQMDYVLTDLSTINNQDQNMDIDGILGFPFLSSCKFSINFKTQELHVWR